MHDVCETPARTPGNKVASHPPLSMCLTPEWHWAVNSLESLPEKVVTDKTDGITIYEFTQMTDQCYGSRRVASRPMYR